jgi:ribonuclease G
VSKRIVVNVGLLETRVAVQEGNLLTELYLERHRHRSIVGNVYKGTVTNVLPGMQAAFVDIGLAKDAFLYAGDYTSNLEASREVLAAEEGEDAADADVDVDEEPRREATGPIEEMLSRSQHVLVQVSKESLGTKGARITSFISLPGRYLVYMPQVNHLGVSRRIHDAEERDRLRQLVRSLRPAGGGFIVRTVGEGRGEAEFSADIQFLVRVWQQIQARFAQAPPRSVLHEEGDLVFRVVRDLFAADIEEILIDGEEEYRRAVEYAEALVPALAHRIHLHAERESIFEARGIEKEIEKAVRRRVWLKSGGYLVIDHTEALVSIDVNTGKYVGKRDLGRRSSRSTWKRWARSCGRSDCAIWAGSSSSTSSTWTGRSTGARCSGR